MIAGVGSLERSRIRWQPLPRPRSEAAAAAAPRAALPASIAGTPDLLHVEPKMMLDAETLGSQLAFAFAGGDAADGIRRALAELAPEPSGWAPESFSRHLFVDELVRTACKVELDGHAVEVDTTSLGAILARPPADASSRALRHGVLEELVASEALAGELRALYRALLRLRRVFLTSAPARRQDATRHRLEVLDAVRAALRRLASGFGGATSALSRLARFGEQVHTSEAFRRLDDLLEHDHRRATAMLELRLGGDGRVRAVAVKQLVEATDNRFHLGVVERWRMMLALWLRGYRFSDEALVDLWIDAVYAELEPWLPVLFQLAAQLEFYLAALAFRDLCAARGLAVCLPVFRDEPGSRLEGLFNPLLLAQGIRPVPGDLVRAGPGTTTIITGPNSGGKTRLLQAIGLAQLLGQCGFFVPAARAELRPVPMLFCSLVQEDTFDQSEGRLGTELLRIRRLFERAEPGALVVLDELCSGTNPSEGEEIFMLVLSLLGELRPETFVTSHFLDFASRLEQQAGAGLAFLQVELGPKEQPTYAFVPGVARTSLASRAAERLGVTRDELLALVSRHKLA